MQLEENKIGEQRSDQQPNHCRRVEHQHRNARRRVDQRAFILLGVACGRGDGGLLQWNVSGRSHSLGEIDIVIVVEPEFATGIERVCFLGRATDFRAAPASQELRRSDLVRPQKMIAAKQPG